jgi:hypothetical protein
MWIGMRALYRESIDAFVGARRELQQGKSRTTMRVVETLVLFVERLLETTLCSLRLWHCESSRYVFTTRQQNDVNYLAGTTSYCVAFLYGQANFSSCAPTSENTAKYKMNRSRKDKKTKSLTYERHNLCYTKRHRHLSLETTPNQTDSLELTQTDRHPTPLSALR